MLWDVVKDGLCNRVYEGIESLEDAACTALKPFIENRSESGRWLATGGCTRLGNAVFVPPPPENAQECMGELEIFLHDKPEHTPVLLSARITASILSVKPDS